MTRVLPVPAPAMIATGPSTARTASSWAALRSARSRSGSARTVVGTKRRLAAAAHPPLTRRCIDPAPALHLPCTGPPRGLHIRSTFGREDRDQRTADATSRRQTEMEPTTMSGRTFATILLVIILGI